MRTIVGRLTPMMLLLLQGPVVPGEEGDEIAAEEEEEIIHKYEPPVPKDWVSMGSEEAVADESLTQNRTLVSTLHHRGYTSSLDPTSSGCTLISRPTIFQQGAYVTGCMVIYTLYQEGD